MTFLNDILFIVEKLITEVIFNLENDAGEPKF